MNEKVHYEGNELEATASMNNYYEWIYQIFEMYLGQDIIEVGAGIGTFSHFLTRKNPIHLSLIEPSTKMFDILQTKVKRKAFGHQSISIYQDIFKDIAEQLKAISLPDSIIYINVMEHIEDDEKELELIFQTLKDEGRLFIFVPAIPFLFSKMDEKLGHFRRYTKGELERKCNNAGFKILVSHYFDLSGILPWFIKYRMMRSTNMEKTAMKLYDSLVIPIIRPLETFCPPIIGKNIVLIAEKVSSND